MLSLSDQQVLLRLARASLSGQLQPASPETVQEADAPPVSSVLDEPAGAFVTLRVEGRLRGCIGRTDRREVLGRVIPAMAIAAATRDPRFPSLHADELDRVRVEISVLGPLVPCQPHEVEIGRDGLVVADGRDRGLLLPEVAMDRGWSVTEFIEATSKKAGLAASAVADGAQLWRFETQHFGE